MAGDSKGRSIRRSQENSVRDEQDNMQHRSSSSVQGSQVSDAIIQKVQVLIRGHRATNDKLTILSQKVTVMGLNASFFFYRSDGYNQRDQLNGAA